MEAIAPISRQRQLFTATLVMIVAVITEPPTERSSKAGDMTHLDLFLQKGPANGDMVAGLDELKRTVLLDGIPSNNDGMVGRVCVHYLLVCS